MPETPYETLVRLLKRADLIGSALDLLRWDEQVNLPPASSARRGGQSAALAELHHQAATDPAIGETLAQLEAALPDLDELQQVVVRRARRDFDREIRLPSAFVAARATLDSEAFHAWKLARERSGFASFAPFLSRQIEMAKQEAAYQGCSERPYDYLLDKFDPGLTEAEVSRLFSELRAELVPFVREIVAAGAQSRRAEMKGFPITAQDTFLREVTRRIGFDFQRGRIDVAVHPFCSGDAADTRLTTRFFEDDPLSSLFSAVHEAGHGLYEQGLPLEHLGTPLGKAVGMAIHESQSRLWENQVARSRSFWTHFEPAFREKFSARLGGWSSDDIYLAINTVELKPIRVESDEVTYNLHIMLRFELERRLFGSELLVADLPRAWNELSRELLGLTPESDAVGVLQDVHWSGGAFGYFPSYCVGNMIAAQFWYAALEAMPDLEARFAEGDFSDLLAWLRREVHSHGRRFDTGELVRKVTGAKLAPTRLMRYLRERYGPLYLPATR
ncbi:MAG: carboxypeptidase M32 [Opitutaceae bacterium]